MIAPVRRAEIKVAMAGRGADGGTRHPANDRTGDRTSRHRTDNGAGARTKQTARNRAITWLSFRNRTR